MHDIEMSQTLRFLCLICLDCDRRGADGGDEGHERFNVMRRARGVDDEMLDAMAGLAVARFDIIDGMVPPSESFV